jgi:uncharacterized membrane protein YtjA (UPF0391 family)
MKQPFVLVCVLVAAANNAGNSGNVISGEAAGVAKVVYAAGRRAVLDKRRVR